MAENKYWQKIARNHDHDMWDLFEALKTDNIYKLIGTYKTLEDVAKASHQLLEMRKLDE